MIRSFLFGTLFLSWPVLAQSTDVDETYRHELIQAFSEEPGLEVTETQTGLEIKSRTAETKNSDDPEDANKPANDQMVVSLVFGIGASTRNQNGFRNLYKTRNSDIDAGTDFKGRSEVMTAGIGVRPSPRSLKRLYLELAAGLLNYQHILLLPSQQYEERAITHSKTGLDAIASAEWDFFFKKNVSVSAGGYLLRNPFEEMNFNESPKIGGGTQREEERFDEVSRTEGGAQVRMRIFLHSFSVDGGDFYVLARINKNGYKSVVMGLKVNIWGKVRNKEKIQK